MVAKYAAHSVYQESKSIVTATVTAAHNAGTDRQHGKWLDYIGNVLWTARFRFPEARTAFGAHSESLLPLTFPYSLCVHAATKFLSKHLNYADLLPVTWLNTIAARPVKPRHRSSPRGLLLADRFGPPRRQVQVPGQ